MARLDTERQQTLEPVRMAYCRSELQKRGFTVTDIQSNGLEFEYRGSKIKLYPYSGWFTGKTVIDGRGIKKLLDQLV